VSPSNCHRKRAKLILNFFLDLRRDNKLKNSTWNNNCGPISSEVYRGGALFSLLLNYKSLRKFALVWYILSRYYSDLQTTRDRSKTYVFEYINIRQTKASLRGSKQFSRSLCQRRTPSGFISAIDRLSWTRCWGFLSSHLFGLANYLLALKIYDVKQLIIKVTGSILWINRRR